MNNRTVTVLGGGGYLGSVLCRQLLREGFYVRCFDLFIFGRDSVKDLTTHPRFTCVWGDTRQRDAVRRVLDGADAVVHLASLVGDGSCNVHPALTSSINCDSCHFIADFCQRAGVRRLLFSSTCSVYGGSSGIVSEDSPTDDSTPYTRTKLAAEKIFLASKSDTFHPTILRLATVFGTSPRMRFDLAVNVMVAQAEMRRHISIFNGQRWRPFIHTADVGRAFIHLLRAPTAAVSSRIFNVGSSHMNLTIGDLGRRIGRHYLDLEVEEAANNDGRDYRVDFSRIEALGFNCRTTLDDGIREIASYVRQHRPNLADSRYNNGLTTKENLGSLLRTREAAVVWADEAVRREEAPSLDEAA
ncbi:MAG TPA: SDR family oxidoreductase [Terriglobia bacterium]|nr:SDR family oxidoreductase [Terriglobia bacterium]